MSVADLLPQEVQGALREGRDAPVTLCVLCDKPITNMRGTHRRVTGFEKSRLQGGTNAVRLRRQLDEYAHDICVDRAAAGVDPRQELFT